jgi:hypothetical protein
MEGELFSTQINDYLARYRLFVEQENMANRYNINIRAESFFIPILKCLFDCPNLINLNIEVGKNFSGLDLGDEIKRIAFQVTSDASSSKIIDCLNKFSSGDDPLFTKFDRLVIFILQNRQGTYKSREILSLVEKIKEKNSNFQFNTDDHIIDFRYISTKINGFESETKQFIHDILMLEIDGAFISPLTKIPDSAREFLDIPMVRRKEEYDRLINSSEDLLIIGKPGIGKTFLLYKIAQEKNAFFVINESRYNLSRAITILKPEILLVDDAHRCPELLAKLRIIRESLKLQFRIIATCWPTEKKEIVRQNGQFGTNSYIELAVFNKDELADLIKSLLELFHFERNPGLEQQIIDQSMGFPGIAVGLFNICRNLNGQDVINGTALLTHLASIALETRSEIEWQKTKRLLAYFSISGISGMTSFDISQLINVNDFEIDTLIKSFQYGGFVFIDGNRIIVQSTLLRAALVKEEFFLDGDVSRIEGLISKTGQSINIISTILDAGELGAIIPNWWLTNLLVKYYSDNNWEKYYRIYPDKIVQGIKNFPETISACIYPALYHEPEFILPLLLEMANQDSRPLHQNPDHVIRKIQDWLSWENNSDKPVERRKYLLGAVKDYFEIGGDQKTITNILSLIISPRFETNQTEPGSGKQVTFTYGVFSLVVLSGIFQLWDDIYGVLGKINIINYSDFINRIYDWAYPSSIISNIGDEIYSFMKNKAVRMFTDMVGISQNHPALLMVYKATLNQLEVDPELDIDTFYSTLFPDRDDYTKNLETLKYTEKIQKLAYEIKKLPYQEICSKIKWVYQEASLVNNPWPCLVPILCNELAKIVDDTITCAKTLIDADLPAESIFPFFEIAVQNNHPDWKKLAEELLDTTTYSIGVCYIIFSLDKPPEDLLLSCLNKLDDKYAGWIKTICMQKKVSINVLNKLLSHSNKKIAFSSAIGEWYSKPQGHIREEILAHWQRVISETKEDDTLLKDIFIANPPLALAWLMNYLFDDHLYLGQGVDNLIFEAIRILDIEQRKLLVVKLINAENRLDNKSHIVSWIVGDNLEIYNFLLESSGVEKIREWQLAPLENMPDDHSWSEKALMALSKGISKEEIVAASFRKLLGVVISGPMSNQYDLFVKAFIKLKENENEKINRLANYGLMMAQDYMNTSLREELKRTMIG